jgi:hypothetical protein
MNQTNRNTETRNVNVTFEKGMHMDHGNDFQAPETYRYAKNLVKRDQYQRLYLSNEHGTKELISVENLVGSVFLKERNTEVYITKAGEIFTYNYDTEERNDVASFSEFGCTMEVVECEWVNVQYSIKGCDTYIHWSSNYVYYWVNLSELENPKRKETLIAKIAGDCEDCNANCDYFKTFRPKCNVLIDTYPSQNGGSLPSGAYIYSARLLTSDNVPTNWSIPSKPVYIGSTHNIVGENSNGAVFLEFKDLDCNYDKIEITVIHYNGSSYTSTVLPVEYFTGTSFTYNHTSFSENNPGIDITEILLRHHLNLEGTDLFPYNGVMYYFGIRPFNKYNVQTIASNVTVNAIVEQYTLSDAKRYQIKSIPYGETLAFGLIVNHDDGTHSEVGHIPCNGGSGNSNVDVDDADSNDNDQRSSGSNRASAPAPTPAPAPEPEPSDATMSNVDYEIKREPKDNTVNDLENDDLLADIEKQLVDSYRTDINDIIANIAPGGVDATGECTDCGDTPAAVQYPKDEKNQFNEYKDDLKDANIADKDLSTAEDIGVKWASILGDYIGEDGKKDLIRTFTPSNIKQAAQDIIDSIKKRERITIKGRKYNISKGTPTYIGDSLTSTKGFSDTDADKPTFPGGKIIYKESTKCAVQNRKYPCIRDCDGNYIYGSLTGTNISHHKFPDETEITYFISNAKGVPSEATPDADEYGDVYINALGAQFDNIVIDKEDYYRKTGKRVCPNNPYTITQVKLTSDNQTILTKGIVIPNYQSVNQGKNYHYPPHAVSSFERVNKFIDTGEQTRIDTGASSADTCCMYSLDQAVLKPFIGSATNLRLVKKLSGIGYRHYLYREGEKADNKTFGRKVDSRGTVSATNLSDQSDLNQDIAVNFATYVEHDTVESPPSGGSTPLMNKHGQPCLWIGAAVPSLNDKSFVGDVLNHNAPITDAQAYYGVLYRELTDQYGPLDNLQYMPILEGRNNNTSISGLFGDRFISPYSYIKTSWVSDKVGNKFPVGNMVSGKSDRCICDNPNDAINSLVGKYIWTQLPKDSDASDAKNWAGTHTPGDALTKKWIDANAASASESQYYYPGTLTHLNTFVGESQSNPFFRQLSDNLEEQVYPYIKPIFALEATNFAWKSAYLSQPTIEVEQPSAAERMLKVLIQSLVNLLAPLLKLEDIFSPDGSLDLTGDIVSLPLFIAAYLLMSKVLFTNDFIDELLGLPQCKTDDEGGIVSKLHKFIINFNLGSMVYSAQRDLYKFIGLKEFTNCGCTDSTINSVYPSVEQHPSSQIDAFKFVKPNSVINFSQENGIIKDMFTGLDGGLYAQTTDSIYSIIQPRARISTDTIFDVITGSESPKPQLVIGASPEGFCGILDRNYAIDTSVGRFFLDYEANKLYRFTGKNLDELSNKGAKTLFNNYTKYCTESECTGEFSGHHYTLGYDPRFDRVLITKNEGDNSWTISYDVIENVFISYHDYIPDKYQFSREDMYSIKDGKLWSHSAKTNEDVKYCNFYGKQYSMEIDITAITGIRSRFSSWEIDTNCDIITPTSIMMNRKITFDQFQMWNTYQSVGVYNLIRKDVPDRDEEIDSDDKIDNLEITRVNKIWRINELYDTTLDYDAPILIKDKCTPFVTLTNYGDHSKRDMQTSEKRKLKDNVYHARLIAKNPSEYKLYLKKLVLLYKIQNR